MQNQKVYFVFDLSSECSFGEGLGVYTSYELAIKAMEDGIEHYRGTDTDIYFHCFAIDVNAPISGYEEIASYTEDTWNLPNNS
ncbi:MAG TPA: hypothetical protein V6D14_17500 [Coleofasciculaceae cyanobacterium]|jgi:hypothetical protein